MLEKIILRQRIKKIFKLFFRNIQVRSDSVETDKKIILDLLHCKYDDEHINQLITSLYIGLNTQDTADNTITTKVFRYGEVIPAYEFNRDIEQGTIIPVLSNGLPQEYIIIGGYSSSSGANYI